MSYRRRSRWTRAGWNVVLASVIASSCTSSPPASGVPSASPSAATSPSASAPVDRVTGWRSDLASRLPAMAKIHPALEHSTSRTKLEAAVADLSAKVPSASDDELLVGVLGVVAMVSAAGCDAHTGAFVWGEGAYPVDSLPLRVWWFDEGLVVVDALPPYRDLIGARIDAVGTRPIKDVLAALDPLVPRDNAATVRLLMPRFFLIPQVLRGLGLIGGGAIPLTVTLRSGPARDLRIEPVPMRDYNAWAGMYGLHLPTERAVLYLSRINDALWWQTLDDATLYVQYNRVDRLPQSSIQDLRTALHAPGVARVIVDIRHNFGGEVSALDAVLASLADPAVDRPGRLFVVTGRNTFSAASLFLARIDATTSAVVVGEPMGGCPTAYGDAESVTLPYSRIVVSVPALLEVGVSKDDRRPTIEPELPARISVAAWLAGQDPALAAIRDYRP